MRDKYNLATINPPVEEDNGNLCDLSRGGAQHTPAQGAAGQPAAPSSNQDNKLVIPGLDVAQVIFKVKEKALQCYLLYQFVSCSK